MNNTQENLLSQLSDLRQLFAESAPADPKVVTNYAWIIVKVLLQHTDEIDSVTARQLLAECLKLPIERPSQLYSALLAAAVKVANTYPEFRFASFLRMWGIENLRPEDHQRQQATVPAGSLAGKSFPSLAEKTTKALAHSLLLHPEDSTKATVPAVSPASDKATVLGASASGIDSILTDHGLSIHQMLVTRINQVTGNDGRKYIFVTLTSPEGNEVECISNVLQVSPLHPLPEGKRHFVNIGQLYDCLLKTKATIPASSPSGNIATVHAGSPASITLTEAYLSQCAPTTFFPIEIGYIESIDQQHAHMHIYDSHSRHFVAHIQRFSKEKAGDFIRFIPIIPQASKFKTAIILATIPSDSSEAQTHLREIRITHINKEKGYAAWELIDKTRPITELLSPLQLSQGETSPSFTSGYLNLTEELSSSTCGEHVEPLSSYKALIYLKRGKGQQKRPHIARLFRYRSQ